jgi:hypothetical protein
MHHVFMCFECTMMYSINLLVFVDIWNAVWARNGILKYYIGESQASEH